MMENREAVNIFKRIYFYTILAGVVFISFREPLLVFLVDKIDSDPFGLLGLMVSMEGIVMIGLVGMLIYSANIFSGSEGARKKKGLVLIGLSLLMFAIVYINTRFILSDMMLSQFVYDASPISLVILCSLALGVFFTVKNRLTKWMLIVVILFPVAMYLYNLAYTSMPVDVNYSSGSDEKIGRDNNLMQYSGLAAEILEKNGETIFQGNFEIEINGIGGKSIIHIIPVREVVSDMIHDVTQTEYIELLKIFTARNGDFILGGYQPSQYLMLDGEIVGSGTYINQKIESGKHSVQAGYVLDGRDLELIERGFSPTVCIKRISIRGNEMLSVPICSTIDSEMARPFYSPGDCDDLYSDDDLRPSRACLEMVARQGGDGSIISGCENVKTDKLRDYCYVLNLRNPITSRAESCDSIEDSYLNDRCTSLAIIELQDDVSSCSQIGDEFVQGECERLIGVSGDFSELAYEYNTSLFCDKMTHVANKSACLSFLAQNEKECALREGTSRQGDSCPSTRHKNRVN